MKIVLVRHGDAVGTKGKFHGMLDTPLTAKGIKDVEEIAPEFRKYKPEIIYSSPLSRTFDSAKIIAQVLGGLEVVRNKALLPLDLGNFVGQPTNTRNVEMLKYYFKNPNIKIPGGEPVNNWAMRFIPFFNKYFYDNNSSTIMFVTHGRNFILTKADVKLGNNLKYDNRLLYDTDESIEHAGYALATPPKNIRFIMPKKVKPGSS